MIAHKKMAGTSPTAKSVTAKCQFILAFTTPSADNRRLSEFIQVSVSSSCGISCGDIRLDEVESRMDLGKTIVAFSLIGKSEIDVWTMVTRIRKAVLDKESPLNTVGMMKRVFNGAVFEGFEPSSHQPKKEPKYTLKAAVDSRRRARLPTPVVDSDLVEPGDVPQELARERFSTSPKVTVTLPKGTTVASWEVKADHPRSRRGRSRGLSSLSVSVVSPSNSRVPVPSSPHIPLNASHYPFDVVMIPSGVKSPPVESPNREMHLHLPPASFHAIVGELKALPLIDINRLDVPFLRSVAEMPPSLIHTIAELKHALTSSS